MDSMDATKQATSAQQPQAFTAAAGAPVPDPRPDAPVQVPAEVPESIEATIDFSEVEFAEEFAEPVTAITPGGVLPLEPAPIEGRLRKAALSVPDEMDECSGFTLFGRRIKSMLYTTDVAVIRNSNADAIFAVYPFTAQPAITQALLTVAECPVFVGVGGGTTAGKRAVQLAAVWRCRAPRASCQLTRIARDGRADRQHGRHPRHRHGGPLRRRGARQGQGRRQDFERRRRQGHPRRAAPAPRALPQHAAHRIGRPLLALHPRDAEAGANAVIWTPPSAQQLQADMMKRYREMGATPEGPIRTPSRRARRTP